MSIVSDFKSIRRKLECQEQKADFEEKNPKPELNKVVWTPEWGYGVAPYGYVSDAEVQKLTDWLKAQPKPAGAGSSALRGWIKANG
jgi:hypothetical protein